MLHKLLVKVAKIHKTAILKRTKYRTIQAEGMDKNR